MFGNHYLIRTLLLSSLVMTASNAIARDPAHSPTPQVAVGAQYDTTHVYVKAADFDRFVNSFTSTLGARGRSGFPPPSHRLRAKPIFNMFGLQSGHYRPSHSVRLFPIPSVWSVPDGSSPTWTSH